MKKSNYLAIDLGATSGRTVLASFDGNKVEMAELTRFKNPMIPLGGHLFWDIAGLYNEILLCLRKLAYDNIIPDSIGIDTWGCDFAFLGKVPRNICVILQRIRWQMAQSSELQMTVHIMRL